MELELELESVLASNTRPARPITNDDERFSSAADIGVRVTSNANEIAHFLRRRTSLIVCSTYQSSPLISEPQSPSDVPQLDVAFADEVHRCVARFPKHSAAFSMIRKSEWTSVCL